MKKNAKGEIKKTFGECFLSEWLYQQIGKNMKIKKTRNFGLFSIYDYLTFE